MNSLYVAVTGMLCLTACSEPADLERELAFGQSSSSSSSSSTSSSNSSTSVSASGNGSSASAVSRSTQNGMETKEESRDYLFAYSWPGEAERIPALAKALETELADARAELKGEASEAKAAAAENAFPFRQHSLEISWQRVADTPRFLSLSSTVGSYYGGAHPNYGSDALVWDKERGARMAASDFFVSGKAMAKALNPQYCPALNALREEKRGAPVEQGSTDSFEPCPPMADLDILLGSTDGATFDRIGLLAAPYVAGPYVEGDYEVTLPVDARVLAAVKPQYKPYFSASK